MTAIHKYNTKEKQSIYYFPKAILDAIKEHETEYQFLWFMEEKHKALLRWLLFEYAEWNQVVVRKTVEEYHP